MDDIPTVNTERMLVTGASGFIGAHLCRALTAHGHHVTGVCRRHPDRLPEGVTARTVDLSDAAAVDALVADVQPGVIFHLAGAVVGRRDRALVRPTLHGNLLSTVHLMTAAADTACRRFVLTGSLEEPAAVDDPPSSPYAASKAAAAAYARMFHALYAFPVVVARVFMVYGPDQKDTQKLVPYVIESLLRGESPRLGSGGRMVDWIHVRDVVDGLLHLASGEGLEGQTIDLGSGEMTAVRTVVERIAALMASPLPLQFGAQDDRPMEQVRVADVARTAQRTGWRPGITLDEGLRDTIAWHRGRHAQEHAARP
jgi:UDP-glucose 4-epimerase